MNRCPIVFLLAMLSLTASAFELDPFPTDESLAGIQDQDRETLRLRGPRGYGHSRVGDSGLQFIGRSKTIKILHLGCLALTDAGLESISHMTQLETLELGGSDNITNAGIAHLARLKNLRNLDLSSCKNLTGESIRHLRHLTQLEVLDISRIHDLSDTSIQHLGGLTKLKKIGWDSATSALTDAGLQHLRALTDLTELRLENAIGVTDKGVALLAHHPKLQELDLRDLQNVSDSGLEVLSRLPELRKLSLVQLPIGNSTLSRISELPNLTWLLIWNLAHDTPEGLVPLGRLSRLEYLRYSDSASPAALREVAKIQTLKYLELTGVDDSALAILCDLKALECLHVGNAATDASIESLAKLTNMKDLIFSYEPSLTSKGKSRLQQALPTCRFYPVERFR
jgi:ABC-type transporter Mla MlaB component